MKLFCSFIEKVERAKSAKQKFNLLIEYFQQADPQDASWALYFLLGNRIPRSISSTDLRILAADISKLPEWLVEESYQHVGDLAETLSLLLKPNNTTTNFVDLSLAKLLEDFLLPLHKLEKETVKAAISKLWLEADFISCIVINRLLIGGLRLDIPVQLLIKALSQISDLPETTLASRLSSKWQPSLDNFKRLLAPHSEWEELAVRPVPFLLAQAIDGDISVLGTPSDFLAEWKWDGVRGQIVFSSQGCLLWARDDQDYSNVFPEIVEHAGSNLPVNTIIDGEILAWSEFGPLPFADLQKRLNRKQVSKKLRRDIPVKFFAFDLLCLEGADLRTYPLEQRRIKLLDLLGSHMNEPIEISQPIEFDNWTELEMLRAGARSKGAEGLIIKSLRAPYAAGREPGCWWKWKLDPFSIDAVLMSAQRRQGVRVGPFSEFTFGIWREGKLLPIARTDCDLSESEYEEVTNFIQSSTTEKFGPVRTVKPELVFEISFEGIQTSARHHSGMALRFPRLKRWRRDKVPSQANHVRDLESLLATLVPSTTI